MIPTTLSANNSPTALSLNSGGISLVTGSVANMMTKTSKESVIGIASIIIEGRAFAEDEFHMLSLRQMAPYTTPPRGGSSGNHSTDPYENMTPQTSTQASAAGAAAATSSLFFNANEASSATASGGRQSPKPSTSKAAFAGGNSSNLPLLINITTNPHHAFGAKTAPLFIETPNNAYHSSSSAASSAESTHQRWTQKLCQLRQASGNTNLTAAPYEQKFAIDTTHPSTSGGEPELVALAIHDSSGAAERGAVGGDYEIVRRVMLSRSAAASAATVNVNAACGSASSSPSSGGSENFLHSLQSLATTCLRGNSPAMDSPTSFATLHYNPSSGSSGGSAHTKYAPYRATANTTTNSTTPRFQSPYATAHQLDLQTGGASASCSGSGLQSPKLLTMSSCHKRGSKVTATVTSNASSTAFNVGLPCTLTPKAMSPSSTAFASVTGSSSSVCLASGLSGVSSASASASSTSSSSSSSATKLSNLNSKSNPYPQQGPHCDQFLRKMGLAKGDVTEAEEHYCDMSYVNITCSRWRAYCLKIEAIIEHGEPVCLEVFLGPANHKILLEQWIISYKEKLPPPTMTLTSLCSAIRSQLYFSQISAWCDLIRKSDKSIYDTGRIVFSGAGGMMGCAGDLATTAAANLNCTPPNSTATATSSGGGTAASSGNSTHMASTTTSSSSSSSTLSTLSRPRLNVFYRIRKYDATACFNSKPNIHNFPNVNVSENCSISICLKSLPRINGGIPKLGATMAAPSDNFAPNNNVPKYLADETPRSSRQNLSKTTVAAAIAVTTSTAACYPNCDNQKQQANVDVISSANDANISHHSSNSAYSTHYKNAGAQLATACSAATQVNKIDCETILAATPAPASPVQNTVTATTSNQHKCKFYIDEAEGAANDDVDIDEDLSEPQCSNGSCGSLSHREKQLLKYRKRMLKRDKKHHNRKSFDDSNSNSSSSNGQTPTTPTSSSRQCQPMEQGDEYDEGDASEQSSVQTVALATARQRATIEMISTGTQTAAVGCCEQCGAEKALICLKCVQQQQQQPDAGGFDEMDACSVTSASSNEIISTPRSKGDLLLQAIQRTPKAAKHKKQTSRTAAGYLNTTNSAPSLHYMRSSRSHSTSHQAASAAAENLNNNHLANRSSSAACSSNTTNTAAAFNNLSPCSSTSSIASLGSGCQVCKRQKTQHNFAAFNGGGNVDNCSGRLQQSCAESQLYSENGTTSDAADAANEADDRDGGKRCYANADCHIDLEFNDAKMSTSESSCDLTAPPNTMRASTEAAADAEAAKFSIETNTSGNENTTKATTATDVMEEECFSSSTKLTPNFEDFVLSGKRSNSKLTSLEQKHQKQQQKKQQQMQPTTQLPPKPLRGNVSCESSTANYQTRSCTPTATLALNIDCQFKTPTTLANAYQEQHQQQQPHKPTPKPTLLQVANAYSSSMSTVPTECSSSNTVALPIPLTHRKTLPKVNLTPIFCNGNSGCSMQHHNTSTPTPMSTSVSDSASSQSPDSAFPFDIVTINRVKFERAAQICTANNNHHVLNNNNTATLCDGSLAVAAAAAAATVPVQKSNSAPTLPNSPSLSPRFAKQAAIYKRRSRHLSDRSDRSSLGSDEQYSDEDLELGSNANLLNGMVISPMKQRARFAAKFSRRPLLGNLEESLLHRRITPKTEVLGFKVLLGASGGFCPTQLTIPAAAFFYELHGETLSTPYLCEIGLPRKGYSVPRTGTVQVTLLNPLGTVVRMFVIPYDMRDMPPLHQTFIRQRVLADMSVAANNQQNGFEHLNGTQNGDSSMQHSGDMEVNYQNGSPSAGDNCKQNNIGHFISAEHMKRLRYCIHLRFQTSRSGRLMLHTDIRLLISRRTDCDTAAAHAKGLLEAPNELIIDTVMPSNPKYSVRHDVNSRI